LLRPLEALDPTGEKTRAVKARYVGVCRGCGADTQPRNGKGDAYAYCKACHPGAIERRWTREGVVDAMLDWLRRYGRLPSSYDWSRTYARRRGGEALRRLNEGSWPSASVVTSVYESWSVARSAVSDALSRAEEASATDGRREVGDWAQSAFLRPIPGNPRYIRGSEVACAHLQKARFAGISCCPGSVARVFRVGEVPGSNPGAPIETSRFAGLLGRVVRFGLDPHGQ
jgi:hypothetical protein